LEDHDISALYVQQTALSGQIGELKGTLVGLSDSVRVLNHNSTEIDLRLARDEDEMKDRNKISDELIPRFLNIEKDIKEAAATKASLKRWVTMIGIAVSAAITILNFALKYVGL